MGRRDETAFAALAYLSVSLSTQLAPEVLAGNYYDGFLSDVWSLGVILYIIISAAPPFYGESDGKVVQKIVAGKPRRAVYKGYIGYQALSCW